VAVVTFAVALFFIRAFRSPQLVPVGAQNIGEAGIEFVDKQIAFPVLGEDSRAWLPFLTAVFFWMLLRRLKIICRVLRESISLLASTVMNRVKSPVHSRCWDLREPSHMRRQISGHSVHRELYIKQLDSMQEGKSK